MINGNVVAVNFISLKHYDFKVKESEFIKAERHWESNLTFWASYYISKIIILDCLDSQGLCKN